MEVNMLSLELLLRRLFNSPQLEGVAREVEDTIVTIMKEAAL